MGSEWQHLKLSEVAVFSYGKMPKKGKIGTGVYPTYSGYKYQYLYPEYNCDEGDLIVVARGVGGTGDVKLVNKRCYLTNLSIKINLDQSKIDNRYFYYFYLGAGLRHLDSGSAQSQITINDLGNVVLSVPPLQAQIKVVEILERLDNKIALNRQINTTLESMAQALFKSWFVDFDPVIDNALAAGNEIPDELAARAARREALRQQTNKTANETSNKTPAATDSASVDQALLDTGLSDQRLPPEIQQLFPDRFVLTEEMGWVPEGWEVKKLGDFAEKISKGTTPSKAVLEQATGNISIPFIKVKDLDDFGEIKLDSLEVIPDSVHIGALKRSVLQVNDVLFSIAGTIGRVAIVPSHLHNSNTNQAVAFVRPQKQSMGTYITMLLRSDHIQGLVNSRVVQAVQANFSLTELAGIPVLDAGTPIFDQWHEQSKAWFSAIALNRDSSVCLSNLRDSLLPQLLSGQITIPDAEHQLAEVM